MPEATLLPGYLIVGPDEVKRDTAVARLRKRRFPPRRARWMRPAAQGYERGARLIFLESLNRYRLPGDRSLSCEEHAAL